MSVGSSDPGPLFAFLRSGVQRFAHSLPPGPVARCLEALTGPLWKQLWTPHAYATRQVSPPLRAFVSVYSSRAVRSRNVSRILRLRLRTPCKYLAPSAFLRPPNVTCTDLHEYPGAVFHRGPLACSNLREADSVTGAIPAGKERLIECVTTINGVAGAKNWR